MTFFPIDGDLRPIAEGKLHHVQIVGMVLPNNCISQDMFFIFKLLSVEIYITSFCFVFYRQSLCLFHHFEG